MLHESTKAINKGHRGHPLGSYMVADRREEGNHMPYHDEGIQGQVYDIPSRPQRLLAGPKRDVNTRASNWLDGP